MKLHTMTNEQREAVVAGFSPDAVTDQVIDQLALAGEGFALCCGGFKVWLSETGITASLDGVSVNYYEHIEAMRSALVDLEFDYVTVNSINFPAAFTAMDKAAASFWAYPDVEWQDNFLAHWADQHGDTALSAALGCPIVI